MSMEDIIRAWKADEETLEPHLPASPVGRELSEEELLEVSGGGACGRTCDGTCPATCLITETFA